MALFKTQHTIYTQLLGAVLHDKTIGIKYNNSRSDGNNYHTESKGHRDSFSPSNLTNVRIKWQWVKEIGDGHS